MNDLTNLHLLARIGTITIRLEDGYIICTQGLDPAHAYATGITQEQCERLETNE
jgi:hypothetical protein